MKKEYSINKLFFVTVLVTLLLLAGAAAGYSVYSFYSYTNQINESNAVYLTEYTSMMKGDMDNLRDQVRNLVFSDPSFQLLTFSDYPDSKIIPVNYTIQEIIQRMTPTCGIVLLHNSRTAFSYYNFGQTIFTQDVFTEKKPFLDSLREKLDRGTLGNSDCWFAVFDGDDPYLAYISARNQVSLTALVNFPAYVDSNVPPTTSDQSIVLAWSGDDMILNRDYMEANGISLPDIRTSSSSVETLYQKHHLIQRIYLPEHGVGIAVATPFRALFRESLPQLVFALSIILLTVFIILLMYRIMKKMLLFPVSEIAEYTKRLEGEELPEQAAESRNIREFNDIRTGLQNLLDRQAELEAERLDKEQAREHAALQYYQLQTRSHFFLNCLKSLYNMSESNKIPQMQAMIIAFSNHLRYIFHDNLMTVTMESELREVTDYHRIILLDYSRIFILTQNVPQEFMQVEVPPLLIQTFLENTYKYNNKTGEPLVFEIRASRVTEDQKDYMKLELSDNGNGYSEEVLSKINEELTGSYDQFNVGINNLRRRLSIIFKDECRTEFYNKPDGGACSVIYIPLTKGEI